MSQKYFTQASTTLFNSGTPRTQMSSCFLLDVEDSIKGIYENLSDCAHISKYAGGIGLNVHDIRSKNSVIRGTNGHTDGIIPMLRVYNATARYVNQSSKRLGSIAVYIEPWHGDIMEWLDLRKNHGAEEERARDLFYAVWISDLFMERVENNEQWKNYKKIKASIGETEIQSKIDLRIKARVNKNYKEADRIRDELLDKGIFIEDKYGKTLWKFK